MIELRALGDLRLRDSEDGREILSVLTRAKPPGVLVYLALSPTDVSHSRDKLLELLWPAREILSVLTRAKPPGVLVYLARQPQPRQACRIRAPRRDETL